MNGRHYGNQFIIRDRRSANGFFWMYQLMDMAPSKNENFKVMTQSNELKETSICYYLNVEWNQTIGERVT